MGFVLVAFVQQFEIVTVTVEYRDAVRSWPGELAGLPEAAAAFVGSGIVRRTLEGHVPQTHY